MYVPFHVHVGGYVKKSSKLFSLGEVGLNDINKYMNMFLSYKLSIHQKCLNHFISP
jgi:hypothetical protein